MINLAYCPLDGKSKELVWVGSSKEDLKKFPDDVQDAMGYALYVIQLGETPDAAKPFKIGKGSGTSVMEIVEDHDTNTYRAVYTVRFKDAV